MKFLSTKWIYLTTFVFFACNVNSEVKDFESLAGKPFRIMDGEKVTTNNMEDWTRSIVVIDSRCTGLLLSPQVVLTASHCLPAHFVQYHDYEESNGNVHDDHQPWNCWDGETWSCIGAVHEVFPVGIQDMVILQLAEPLPVNGYWNMTSFDYSSDHIDQLLAPVQGISGNTDDSLTEANGCSTVDNFSLIWSESFGSTFNFYCSNGYPWPGDSGAPIFHENGELIGVISQVYGSEEKVYGIASYLKQDSVSMADIYEYATVGTNIKLACPHGSDSLQLNLQAPHIDEIEVFSFSCGLEETSLPTDVRTLIGDWYSIKIDEPEYQLCIAKGDPLEGVADLDGLELDIMCMNEGAVHSAVTSMLL